MEFRADLHCHSTCSDGTFSPEEIVLLACKKNLKGLAITDHDTIAAYAEALPAAKAHQIPMITGVEFSAVHKKTNIHILAYSFAPQASILNELCQMHCLRRIERNQAILDLLAFHGMPLDADEFKISTPASVIGRPHIALAMMKRGYVASIQQAFHLYIGEGRPCYSPGEKISVEETIDIIHQAKGLAVIAHPHLVENADVMRDLLTMSFDGIEAYYGRFPAKDHERWLKIGLKKNWLITGGSDFHGTIKPNLSLGSSWVNEETFNILYRQFLQNQVEAV